MISGSVSVLNDSSYPVEGSPPQPLCSPSDLDVLIILCKHKWSCIDHPIFNFISYGHLNSSFRQFALSLTSVFIPRSYEETILVPDWKQAMDEEMYALVSR